MSGNEVDTGLNNSNNNNTTSTENASVRNEMVETAIRFLKNPKVTDTPLAQKQKFLQRKGLTDEEIKLACEKSGAYDQYEQQQSYAPLLPASTRVVPYNQQGQIHSSLFDRLKDLVHNVAIFSIVAYAIYKFYKKFIEPFLFGKKKKSIEESLEELKQDLSNVKVEVDKISQETDINTQRHLAEIKSEIGTVKGLLLSRKQFPSLGNSSVVPPSIPAWQMSSVPQDTETEGDQDRKAEDIEDVGSGSGSSEPEHGTKTSDSSLEIIYSSRDCDTESCHSRKSKEDNDKD